jgi:hypothetical protein
MESLNKTPENDSRKELESHLLWDCFVNWSDTLRKIETSKKLSES